MRFHFSRALVSAAALLGCSLLGPFGSSTLFWPSALAEDVIVLTSGRELRGEVVEETEDRVKVKITGGSVWYPRSRIQEIRRRCRQ